MLAVSLNDDDVSGLAGAPVGTMQCTRENCITGDSALIVWDGIEYCSHYELCTAELIRTSDLISSWAKASMVDIRAERTGPMLDPDIP